MDPVQGLVVPHHMLEDHDLQHLLGLVMEKLALIDEGSDMGVQGMDTFIG